MNARRRPDAGLDKVFMGTAGYISFVIHSGGQLL